MRILAKKEFLQFKANLGENLRYSELSGRQLGSFQHNLSARRRPAARE
jgi:hypothetical protein